MTLQQARVYRINNIMAGQNNVMTAAVCAVARRQIKDWNIYATVLLRAIHTVN